MYTGRVFFFADGPHIPCILLYLVSSAHMWSHFAIFRNT